MTINLEKLGDIAGYRTASQLFINQALAISVQRPGAADRGIYQSPSAATSFCYIGYQTANVIAKRGDYRISQQE